jgi:peptide/nickel transport system substrate-binding protein
MTMVMLLLAGCGGAGTAGARPTGTAQGTRAASTAASAVAGKTLSLAMYSAPSGFNGMVGGSGYDTVVSGLMFDTLVWQSPDQKFHPKLASSWDVSADSKTITFHIDPRASWTDGQPVTASDVAWTLQMITDPKVPSQYGSLMSILAGTNAQGQNVDPSQPPSGVRVVDAKTVELITKQPTDPDVVLYNIGAAIQIYPEHALQGVADTALVKAPFFQDPTVSDGPFEFVKYVNSQYVQLKPNPSYHLGAPKIDQLFIKVVPATSMLAELRDGEVDATIAPGLADVPLQDWPSIASLPNVKQDPVPGTINQFMMINSHRPYLSNPSVREAIAMAINRQVIVSQLLKGQGSVPNGPVSPQYTTWYAKSVQPWPYDPVKAKQMLQAANFPFSQSLTLLVPTGNQIRMESAPLIQQNLKAVGLNVQIQQMDFATMLATAKKGQFDFELEASDFGVDPSQTAVWFACGATLNYGQFCDPKIDQDYQAAQSTAVLAQRQAAYDDLQQRLHDEVPMVFLYIPNGLLAYNIRLNQAAVPTVYGMQQPWLWDVSR